MKTKMFNKRLFLDMFKQLAPMALLFIGLMTFLSMSYNFDLHKHVTEVSGDSESYIIAMLPINYALLFYSAISPALMTIFAFRFLNSRKANDFYHSIPESRVSLFNSVFASVTAWTLLGIVFETLLNIGIFGLFSSDFNYIINYGSIVPGICSLLSIAFVSAASFALAASFSGILIQSAVFGVMVLFTPTMYIFMLNDFLQFATPYAPSLPLVSTYDNLCTAIFIEGLNVDLTYDFAACIFGQSLLEWKYIFSTLLIGVLTYLIAVIVFKRRQSEIANTIKSDKKKNVIIGIWIGSLITLMSAYEPIANILYDHSGSSYYYIFMSHLLALVVYLFYIYLTTSERKALPKMAVGFVGVLLVEAASIGLTGIIIADKASFTPSADEVESVTVNFNNGKYHSMLMHVELIDEDAIELVTEALEKKVSMCKSGEWDDYRSNVISLGATELNDFYVTFKTGTEEESRFITVTNEEMEVLLEIIRDNSDKVKFDEELPEINEKNSLFLTARGDYGVEINEGTPGFDPYKLYECIKEDLKNGAGTNYYPWAETAEDQIAYINFAVLRDNKLYEYAFHAYGEDFVKTKEYVEKCIIDQQENNRKEMISALESGKIQEYINSNDKTDTSAKWYIKLTTYNAFDEVPHEIFCNAEPNDLTDEKVVSLVAFLKEKSKTTPKTDGMYATIEITYTAASPSDYKQYNFIFSMDYKDDIPEFFKPYLEKALQNAIDAKSAADTAA